jgi:outer membrane receptor protein involved in Fe transport
LISGETCSASSGGQYDVSEYYGELFFPLLKNVPGAYALNATVGTRFSDYSSFGSTTNSTLKIEYRPISDLLLRSSYAEVFRAPTLYNLSHGPKKSAETFNDPCVGVTAADISANPKLALACVNVPTNGTFSQDNSQVDSLKLSNGLLKPETGDVLTYGVVYDPGWLPDLSLSVDFWHYKIKNVITELDVNYTADQCIATGAASFCNLIVRNTDGSILEVKQPYVNLGVLKTNGFDVGVKYALPGTPLGSFRFALDTTYIGSYGVDGNDVSGTFDRQFGNYAKWRANIGIGWSARDFTALWSTRYIHSLRLTDPDGFPGVQPDLEIPAVSYSSFTFGYTLPTATKLQFGVDNMFDKEPPIFYQNNVTNSNTDVATYDTIGRRWYVSVSQKF